MSRFIAFDVETPNYYNNRMSAIGITVIEDGAIVDEYYSLVNPEQRFDAFNIDLTGIDERKVADAPTFPQLWNEIEPIMSSGLLVAHNAVFDMNVLKKCLLTSIDNLSATKVETPEGNVDVEYGYAVGSENNIKAFSSHYGISDPTKYQLQYKGENVNGVNTTGETRTAQTDYRYINNVNCTRGTTNENGTIKDDHRNFTNYRLYTLIVTYKNNNTEGMKEKVSARSYIRYYDANGKLRVFYNTYKKSMYSGCMCSYNQVADMAISQNLDLLEQQQTMNNN